MAGLGGPVKATASLGRLITAHRSAEIKLVKVRLGKAIF